MPQHVDWNEVESLDPARSESPLDLFGILWRRKWIVVCVAVIAVALGYLYFLQATRIYRSVAQVLLIKRDVKVPVSGGSASGRDPSSYGGYEDMLSTHMLLIRSPLVVSRAVEKHHLQLLSSLKNTGDAASTIIEGLQATRAGDRGTPDPNVMELWYEGVDAREAAQILGGIVQSYRDFLSENYHNFGEETLQLVSQARDSVQKQLDEKRAQYKQFQQESPLIGKAAINLHEQRMAEIEKKRDSILVANTELKARIESLQTAIKQGGNREALALLISKAQSDANRANNGPRAVLEDKLFEVLLKEQELSENVGQNHPTMRALKRREQLLREQLGNLPLPEGTDSADFLTVYLESLRQELRQGEEQLAAFDSQFDAERKESQKLGEFQRKEEQFKFDIENANKTVEAVVKRLQEITLIKDYTGIDTQLIAQPCMGVLVRPKLPLVLGLAGVMGLVLGAGLAYLVDVADKSFRSPEEIRRQLGLPVIGHIPVIESSKRSRVAENAAPGLSPILATYYQPKSRPAEAYRAVRTSLYFSTHGEGHRVIQVTSPNPGDGKTTLAANLAVAMADSGKRVLLLEADFRRPRVHRYFALDNTIGVSSIITGDAEIPDVIQPTAIRNLWAMPCGPRPNNPSDLLTSPRFKEMIDTLRDQHDFVIIDTPPILAVTDASVVAPRVDAVLLVVRLTKHARDGASRATEMLGALGARILGVVVNGVAKSAGYGYGSGRYGYGSYRYGGSRYGGYRYGGSSYGDGYGDSYYRDDNHEPAAPPARREGAK